jgi:hypothetical protein
MKKIAEQAATWTQAFVNALDVIETDTNELEYLRPDVAAICQYMRSICMEHGTTDDHCRSLGISAMFLAASQLDPMLYNRASHKPKIGLQSG